MNPDRDRPWVEVAARLKSVRTSTNLNQREFAERLGVSVSRYKNWESGAHRLSLDGALAISNAFGTSLDFIYAPLLARE